MPISDLLASISGKSGTANTTSTIVRPSSGPKRKADDDLRRDDFKATRVDPPVSVRPSPSTKLLNRSDAILKPNSTDQRPSGLSRSSAPASHPGQSKPIVKPILNGRSSGPLQNASHRPANSTPNPSVAPRNAPSVANAVKAPPKKGSFAEILARGRQAQAQMGHVGVIQHKKVEKGAVFNKKREAENAAPAHSSDRTKSTAGAFTGNARTSRKGALGGPRQGNGSSRLLSDGPMINGKDSAQWKRGRGDTGSGSSKKTVQDPPKKVKKAATATTGYTGTSRPRPATSSPKRREQSRGGALLNQPRAYGGSRSRSYGDDDDDMDDFIDYDDEDDNGPRYDYASDGSSDMEAGLGDIDDEERRAEAIARREDIEEERLEKSLKLAKEERKKKALEELRARRR